MQIRFIKLGDDAHELFLVGIFHESVCFDVNAKCVMTKQTVVFLYYHTMNPNK